MRVLWILCLLIGSITCGPMWKGRGQSSEQGSSSSLPSQHNPNMVVGNAGGNVGYGGQVYGSPVVGYSAPSRGYSQGSNYGGNNAGAYGVASYGSASAQDEAGNSGSSTDSGASVEALLPVFSDVSNLEPVSSFRSRSRYQRGRSTFVQTRYSPAEPAHSPVSFYNPVKTVQEQNSPAKEPTKGGY